MISIVTTVCVVAIVFLASKMVNAFVEAMATRRRTEKGLVDFPGEPRHWLFGHLHLVDSGIKGLEAGVKWTNKHKYGYPLWVGPFRMLFECSHPVTVKAILSTAEPKDEWAYGFIKPWLGDGLLMSKGEKWTRNRKLLTPGFHFDILKPYLKIFNDTTSVFVNKLSDMCGEGSVNVMHHVSLLTLDSLMKCIFSIDAQCQTAKEMNPYIKSVFGISALALKRFYNFFHHSDLIYYCTSDGRNYKRQIESLHGYTRNVIKKRKAAFKEEQETGQVNTRKYVDFIDILLSAKDEDGVGLTDQEIQDEVDTFMFEGHDTTASGISWCLYNLAKNPEHQRKCQEEIDEFFASKGSAELEWEDLNGFPYMTMCIKESLRISPTVPVIVRQITKPLNLPDGRTFQTGTSLRINIYNLHHNSHVWDDPEVYDPSRFLPENVEKRSPHAFVPFSAGPRNCIGQNFAMNEIKVVISMVLHNFEVSLDEKKPPRMVAELILRAADGMYIYFKKRKV